MQAEKQRETGTKVAKKKALSRRGTNARRNKPKKPPMMSMVQQITVTRKFVKNAKRNDTDEAEKVHRLDATIGTTFLVLHGLNVL